jgi:uncharacterized membrane protein YccF (DUF307 family)
MMAIDTQPEQITTIQRSAAPGCLIQALWFVFIGWWLGALSIAAAWFLNITIIGLPLGMAILNNIPRFLSLQPPRKEFQVIQSNGNTFLAAANLPQRNFLLRAFYFLIVGWWWSAIWLLIAYLLCITVILIPLSLQMFRLTPFMTTLKRY